MTKHGKIKAFLIAGAALGAGAANAQSSVTLYGAVDDAFVYANNQKGHSNFYLRQGNLYASKWGLRGVEDIGGGTSVIFDLQNGFDLNSGALSSSSQIFNREAFVGLQNQQYGTFTMGRQYTPYYLFVGPLASSTWLTGATGAHPGDIDGLDTTIRINNALVYTTPTWNGLQASGMYALGGIAGSTGKGQTISAGVKYATGPIGLAAGYLRMDNAQRAMLTPALQSPASPQHSAINQNSSNAALIPGQQTTLTPFCAQSRSISRQAAAVEPKDSATKSGE